MQSISLVILAAGLGSRYGGLKQTDGMGPNQETLLDYAIYDGLMAGFTQIAFVVRESMMPSFKEALEARWGSYMNKYYPKACFECILQKIDDLPEGCERPVERTKPWGTAHALWAARECIHEPFAMINADDFYGRDAFLRIAQHLRKLDNHSLSACMVGYPIIQTLSENGSVSRGICEIKDGKLSRIVERTHIETDGTSVWYKENDTEYGLFGTETVSMNLMGFSSPIFTVLKDLLARFFTEQIEGIIPQQLSAECYIPSILQSCIERGLSVPILESNSVWFGVTYPDDAPVVCNALLDLVQEGAYPTPLWTK
tara:strand:+ start:4368 stop:5306 length:939 start_codon:yes stop_codon:yes gene_type:complete